MKNYLFSFFFLLLILGAGTPAEAQVQPYIVSIGSNRPDGWYGAGQTIDLIVRFSEPVQGDSINLYLNSGRTCSFSVWYASEVVCNYVVQSGDYASPLRVNSISGSLRNSSGWSVVDFVPRDNLDRYRMIRVGNSSSYTPYVPYNPYGYSSYPYNPYSYDEQVRIREVLQQIAELQRQIAARLLERDLASAPPTTTVIETIPSAPTVAGAYTVRQPYSIQVPFPVSQINRDLWYGMSGDDVLVLQGFLTSQVRYIPPTGWFGPQTQAALKTYQARIGFPVTGVFDLTLRNYLASQGY